MHSICITGFSAAARFVSVGTPTSAHRTCETTTSTSHLLRNDDGDIQDRHQAAARDEGLGEGEGREEGGGGPGLAGFQGTQHHSSTAEQPDTPGSPAHASPPSLPSISHTPVFVEWTGMDESAMSSPAELSRVPTPRRGGVGGGAKEGQSAFPPAPPHIFPGHTPTPHRSPSATREAAYQPPRPRTEAAAPARAHARHARTQQAAHFIWAPPSTPSRNEWRRTRARSG